MERVKKEFARYVSVNIAGMIGLSVYILADTFYVSKALGINGLAALNFAVPIYSLINATGLMLGIGGGSNYSFYMGSNEKEKANKAFTTSVFLGLILGLMFLLAGIFLPYKIASLLGADGYVQQLSGEYMRVILCFAPAFILNNVLIAFVRNDKAPSLSMLAMILGSLSNIILDYVFMFPLKMGMLGAAVATGIAPLISIAVLSLHIIKHKNNFHIITYGDSTLFIKKICRLGASSFITELASAVTMIVFNLIIINVGGEVCVAAYGIIANIALVVIAIFTGIAQGIQPIISTAFAQNDRHTISKTVKYGAVTALIGSVLIYLLSCAFSGQLVSIFNSENSVLLMNVSKQGIYIYFIGFFFAGLNIVMISHLNSTGKTNISFLMSILRGVVIIVPVSLIMSRLFGMNGVWCSFVITEMLTLCFCIFRKKIDVVK